MDTQDRIILNIAGQPPQEIDGNHYKVVFEREFPAAHGPIALIVRRCGHGSFVAHSRNAAGVDLMLDASPPTPENITKALRHCLPEMTDEIAADVLPRMIDEILAKPLPEKTKLADDAVGKALGDLLGKALKSMLEQPPTKVLAADVFEETPNEQGEIEVRMSAHGPVIIHAATWPVVAAGFFGAEGIACVSMRVRQHAEDGRMLIYGKNTRLDGKGEPLFSGTTYHPLPSSRGADREIGSLISTITGQLMGPGPDFNQLVYKLIQQLPPVRL